MRNVQVIHESTVVSGYCRVYNVDFQEVWQHISHTNTSNVYTLVKEISSLRITISLYEFHYLFKNAYTDVNSSINLLQHDANTFYYYTKVTKINSNIIVRKYRIETVIYLFPYMIWMHFTQHAKVSAISAPWEFGILFAIVCTRPAIVDVGDSRLHRLQGAAG